MMQMEKENVSEWQPIETAPTDGRKVLLWFRTCREPSTGWYECDESFEDRPKGWASPEHGWRNDGDMCIPRNQEDCTHWMPLPRTLIGPPKPIRYEFF